MSDGSLVSSTDEGSRRNASELLQGKTLSVYWFMVRESRPCSAREIQRRVGLSSSSLALHHLNKLIESKLVSTDSLGRYVVVHRTNEGLLGLFLGSGRFFIPRLALYAAAYSGFLLSFVLFLLPFLEATSLFLIAAQLIMAVALWVESAKHWGLQPL